MGATKILGVLAHAICKLIGQVADQSPEPCGIGAANDGGSHRLLACDSHAFFDGTWGAIVGHPGNELVGDDN